MRSPNRDRPLPVYHLLVGTPAAAPTARDWSTAGAVSAPDDIDAAYQAATVSTYLTLPCWMWVRSPEGKTTGVLVTPGVRT